MFAILLYYKLKALFQVIRQSLYKASRSVLLVRSRLNNMVDVSYGIIQIIIYNYVLIVIYILCFLRCPLKPLLYSACFLCSSAYKPLFKLLSICRNSGYFSLILSAPCGSISRITSLPSASLSSTYSLGVP